MTKTNLFAWIGGGTSLAVILAAGTLALWPESQTDKARDDGKAFGNAVVALQTADSPDDVDAAMVDLHDAAADTRDHVGDELDSELGKYRDALERAADGFVGERTSDNDWDQDLYHSELQGAVDDLNQQADELATQGPEVRQAFYDGYQEAITSN